MEGRRMDNNYDYWKKRYEDKGGERTVGHKDWSNEEYFLYKKKLCRMLIPIIKLYSNVGCSSTRVLDFGCGIGRFTDILYRYHSYYLGVDIVKVALDRAKKQHGEKSDLDFRLIRDNKLPVKEKEEGFDLIWSCVVMQHIVDDSLLQKYFEQFKTILKKQGCVLFVESLEHPHDTSYMCRRTEKDYENLLDSFSVIHLSSFTIYNGSHGVFLAVVD